MSTTVFGAGLFASAMRRRNKFTSTDDAACSPKCSPNTRVQHEMKYAKAFGRLNNGYQLPISKFPSSGLML
jgi:hypothetical protein